MQRFDYFTGAQDRWRAEATWRAKQARLEHGEDALGYARRRVARASWASFQRRRWRLIRRLIERGLA